MHQQVPSPDTYRHREHNVLERLRRDRTRVWDWDVDVGDFLSSVDDRFPAERNDGCDPLRIGTRQLLCIFEAAEKEPFPNLGHLPPNLGQPGTCGYRVETDPILPSSMRSSIIADVYQAISQLSRGKKILTHSLMSVTRIFPH
jgi:hypothetical protein